MDAAARACARPQYEHWGALFVPAYAFASIWAVSRGKHFYAGNWFEREARRHSSQADTLPRPISGRRGCIVAEWTSSSLPGECHSSAEA
jgi:hypothetical protein